MIAKRMESPSSSEPVKVMSLGLSCLAITSWLSAFGAALPFPLLEPGVPGAFGS